MKTKSKLKIVFCVINLIVLAIITTLILAGPTYSLVMSILLWSFAVVGVIFMLKLKYFGYLLFAISSVFTVISFIIDQEYIKYSVISAVSIIFPLIPFLLLDFILLKKLRQQYDESKPAENQKQISKKLSIIINAAVAVAATATLVFVALPESSEPTVLDTPKLTISVETNHSLEVTGWGFIDKDKNTKIQYTKLYFGDNEVIEVFPYSSFILLAFDESEFPIDKVTEEIGENGGTYKKTTTIFNGGQILNENTTWEYSLADGVLTILQND
ncbi:MAG: hypothetical protein LBL87_01710 [Ruminococcus sp.]|nr:hypothetical protein [Ruminococcus sp.]